MVHSYAKTARGRALVGVLAVAALLMVPSPASASSFDYKCVGDPSYACVKGTITVSRDVTSWNLTIKDNRSDGTGVYAKVGIDRNNLPDPEFRSQNVGPAGAERSFSGGPVQYSGTRGAYITLCRDRNNQPDECHRAHYEPEMN